MAKEPAMLWLRLLAVIAVSTVVFLPLRTSAQDQRRKPIIDVDIVKYIKNNPTPHQSIMRDIENSLVKPLIELAQTERRYDDAGALRVVAINLLGQLRVADAAWILVHDIDFLEMGPQTEPRPPIMAFFPSARALINIGIPAIEAIFSKCQGPVEDKNLILYAWVISHIDGDEVGKYRIELEMKKPRTSEEKRKNLEKLFEVYKTKKEYFPLDEFLTENRQTGSGKEQVRDNNSEDVRKEQPEPGQSKPQQKTEIVKPGPKEEAPQAQERTDWLVSVLCIAVVVLAGAVIFLLLRRRG